MPLHGLTVNRLIEQECGSGHRDKPLQAEHHVESNSCLSRFWTTLLDKPEVPTFQNNISRTLGILDAAFGFNYSSSLSTLANGLLIAWNDATNWWRLSVTTWSKSSKYHRVCNFTKIFVVKHLCCHGFSHPHGVLHGTLFIGTPVGGSWWRHSCSLNVKIGLLKKNVAFALTIGSDLRPDDHSAILAGSFAVKPFATWKRKLYSNPSWKRRTTLCESRSLQLMIHTESLCSLAELWKTCQLSHVK